MENQENLDLSKVEEFDPTQTDEYWESRLTEIELQEEFERKGRIGHDRLEDLQSLN